MPSLLKAAVGAGVGRASGRVANIRRPAQGPFHAPARGSRNSATPPAISMPRPSLSPAMPNRSISVGGSALMGTAWGAMVGGVTGGIYNTDGGFSAGGAVSGALGGAMMGAAAGVGLPKAARAMVGNNRFMSMTGSYASNVISTGRALNTSIGRNAMFASGGFLGGAAMSSFTNNNKRRGFNQNRGNRIN